MARPTNREVRLRDVLNLEKTFSYVIVSRPLMGFTRDQIKETVRKIKADVAAGANIENIMKEEELRFLILQNRMALLQARFSALGDTWQDQEHARFSQEFRETMKVLKKFIESSNQHTPFLLRKAQRIEEYLDQH